MQDLGHACSRRNLGAGNWRAADLIDWADQPCRETSLAVCEPRPTAYLHAENPEHRSSRFYNTVVGHAVALGAGFFAVWILNAWNAPNVMATGQLTAVRVEASTLAITLTIFAVLALRASHQPAGATTLLVTLGTFQTLQDALIVLAGVLLTAIVGEPIRRLRLGKPAV